jgi:hypothetical protein
VQGLYDGAKIQHINAPINLIEKIIECLMDNVTACSQPLFSGQEVIHGCSFHLNLRSRFTLPVISAYQRDRALHTLYSLDPIATLQGVRRPHQPTSSSVQWKASRFHALIP